MICLATMTLRLSHWDKVLRPTWHKIRHFILPS